MLTRYKRPQMLIAGLILGAYPMYLALTWGLRGEMVGLVFFGLLAAIPIGLGDLMAGRRA